MRSSLAVRVAVLALAGALFAVPASSAAAEGPDAAAAAKKGKGKKGKKALVVCKHGCKHRTIQSAVDAAKKKRAPKTIKVRPGKYVEGVVVEGHKYDGLTIKGTGKSPRKVILEGKNAKGPDGLAQNGIEAIDVRRIKLLNMWARNYATNGFFVRDSNPGARGSKVHCANYLMKNLVASFNRSYGLYAFGCKGGRITRSEGWGHGDSAFYIGATPAQKNPKWTSLDHLEGYENVLGYSGTNSRYVDIHHSAFYNNGVGIVPNTLDSEPFEPSANGKIRDNDIFWNNFNYFLPSSRVKTVSNGIGEIDGRTVQFPTGVGVVLLGTRSWEITGNRIFGNFMWGVAAVSNPLNSDDDAVIQNNRVVDNTMGRNGADRNGFDLFSDGSGKRNCYQGNVTETTDHASATGPVAGIYPGCPAPSSAGTGGPVGDLGQFARIVGYVTTDPPENQECEWQKHPHPKFKRYKPLAVKPGPAC